MAGVPNSAPGVMVTSIGKDWVLSEDTSSNQLFITNVTTGAVYKFSAFSTFTTQQVALGGTTINYGNGAPTANQPKGSLYLRQDGAVGSTLYVSQGGGTWNAVASV